MIMRRYRFLKKLLLSAAGALFLTAAASGVSFGQSKNFKLVQDLEVQYNILRTLATEYVDTLSFSKILRYGIDAMLESLDPYTEFVPEENEESIELITTASYGGIGATIRKIDSLGVMIMQPYPNSPAVKFNLEPGDIILKIDGADLRPLTVDECSKRMRGAPGTEVTFTVKKGRTGKVEDIVVTRDRVHTSDVAYYGMLNNVVYGSDIEKPAFDLSKTGYIRVSSFTLNGADDVRRALMELKEKGAERIVLDLRGNGGGLMNEAIDIVSLFVPKGTLVASAKGRGEGSSFTCVTDKDPVDTLIKLAVLVNSSSASSSEIVAGALQDLDRATIIGTRTYGKGLVQSFRPVGYNGKLKLTTSKYYTPSGRCIQILDYSHRNADGSVGAVPDSLKKAFKTKNGRTVYDGGGITPDTTIKSSTYSRPVYALVMSGIMEDYAVDFYSKNTNISAPEQINLTDEQYNDFVKYAAGKKFDQRSAAEVLLEQLVKEAKEEKLYEKDKAEFDALSSKLNLSKEQVLNQYKEDLKPMVEEEIIQKYFFTGERIKHMLNTDVQLLKALAAWK